MKSILSKAKPSDVITEPFPHLLIKDALDEDLYLQLALEFPSIATISQGIENDEINISSNNKRLHYLAQEALSNPQISSLWKDFIGYHTSNSFLGDFLRIFKEHILQMYPNFEKEYGSFETLKSGLRKIDTFESVDVLLDALISINTPVITKPTAVRRAHVDLPDKLFAGLFYMRDPQDTSTGGELKIYKFKNGKPCGFRKYESADRYVEYVKTVKYEQNVFVIFINSLYSLHGVSIRSLTKYPRYFVNLVGEVKKPLFDSSKYQELPHMSYVRKMENLMKKVVITTN